MGGENEILPTLSTMKTVIQLLEVTAYIKRDHGLHIMDKLARLQLNMNILPLNEIMYI